MATRSRIGLLLNNGKVISVYCQNEGYPSGIGADLLRKDFQNTNEVYEFIREGYRSTIDTLSNEYAPENIVDVGSMITYRKKDSAGELYSLVLGNEYEVESMFSDEDIDMVTLKGQAGTFELACFEDINNPIVLATDSIVTNGYDEDESVEKYLQRDDVEYYYLYTQDDGWCFFVAGTSIPSYIE